MDNLVELTADDDEQKQSPCKHGNIVIGHACYCHHPDSVRKCPIWKWHAEDLSKWHSNGDWDKSNWDGGCKFFEHADSSR
jgi:hypothetical protein